MDCKFVQNMINKNIQDYIYYHSFVIIILIFQSQYYIYITIL